MLTLVHLGKLKNPYFDPSQAIGLRVATFLSHANDDKRVLRLYNRPGPTHRGESRPVQTCRLRAGCAIEVRSETNSTSAETMVLSSNDLTRQ